MIDSSGGSRGEVLRRIGIDRSCINMLERRIWKSSIRLERKLRLYQTYIVRCASFDVRVRDLGHHKVPALSSWCIWHVGTHACKILRIRYTGHVSNAEVRGTTGCSPLCQLVTNRRLQLFGHIARSSPREDYHWALAAAIRQVPPDWKRPILGSVQ